VRHGREARVGRAAPEPLPREVGLDLRALRIGERARVDQHFGQPLAAAAGAVGMVAARPVAREGAGGDIGRGGQAHDLIARAVQACLEAVDG